MATLKDVAKDAGVGVSTASVVLSRGPQLSQIPEVTQERIRKSALKVKYRPTIGGRQLRHNRTGTIALFLSAEADRSSLSSDLLYAIHDELLVSDYGLNFVRLRDDSLSDPEFIPRFLRQNEVDGVLMNYNVNMPKRIVDLVHYYEIPSVFMNTRHAPNAIYFDHYKATQDATERLIKLGHRHIHFVNYSGSYDHYSLTDSISAYQKILAENGLKPAVSQHYIPRSERVAESIRLLKPKEGSSSPPTAIMTPGISSTFPLIQAAQQIGLRIPEHLSIVATDGTQNSGLITPSPSHIFLPWGTAGKRGVQHLLNKINNENRSPEQPCVECEWREAGVTLAPVFQGGGAKRTR